MIYLLYIFAKLFYIYISPRKSGFRFYINIYVFIVEYKNDQKEFTLIIYPIASIYIFYYLNKISDAIKDYDRNILVYIFIKVLRSRGNYSLTNI